MAKKLYYFHLNGLAESIRYILHYGGEEFEDIRYVRSDWPIQSVKDNLPYGQIPVYEEGGKTLNQSMAIARYLGNTAGLLPSDPWEQALLDAAALNVYDYWKKALLFRQERTDLVRKAVLRKEFVEETVPYFLSRFDKELASNGYFGGKLSWADFYFVGVMEAVDLFYGEVFEKNYPNITALMKTITNLPRVKEYIATRKPYFA